MTRPILLLLVLFIGCHPQWDHQTGEKSDRQEAGVIGPVASVKVESTYFKRENGKWIESERVVHEQSEYDKSGKLINQKKTPMYGDPAPCRLERKYDDRHRAIETFCKDDPRRILNKYLYEDDRFGNWTKMVSTTLDGGTFRPQSTIYRAITYFQ